MTLSLCPYRGGKIRLARPIIQRICNNPIDSYREPFVGGGSIGVNLTSSIAVPQVWLNDLDPTVYCMWRAAARYPDLLKQAVRDLVPSRSEFDRVRMAFLAGIAVPATPEGIARIGAEKIFIHKVSFAAMGQMSRSPAKGRNKWNPEGVCAKIDELNPMLKNARITSLDFSNILQDGDPSSIYLDPPYFVVGDQLYQHAFSYIDHLRLRKSLRYSQHNWLLSYNDCPEVRDFYAFATIEEISVVYTGSHKQTHELLISPPNRNRTTLGWMPSKLAA